MKYSNNSFGYSIILSLLLIGFLLVMTTGIFRLVLSEMLDNKGIGKSIGAYAGAEGAQEIALLKLKEYGYGYDGSIEHTINQESIALSDNRENIGNFNKHKEVYLSYNFDAKSKSFSGTLGTLDTHIIPLFTVNETGELSVNGGIDFSITSGNSSHLAWNIISQESGITGIGGFSDITLGNKKEVGLWSEQSFSEESIGDFLGGNTNNYLVLYNINSLGAISYTLSTRDQYFTKPNIDIISSGEIGGYRQNLSTKINNEEFLFSIFSN